MKIQIIRYPVVIAIPRAWICRIVMFHTICYIFMFRVYLISVFYSISVGIRHYGNGMYIYVFGSGSQIKNHIGAKNLVIIV